MSKRGREDAPDLLSGEPPSQQRGEPAGSDPGFEDGESAGGLKRARTFMATLACDVCRSRKTRCDEDRPKCGYCRTMNIPCTYQTPRPTKKDQSMSMAINAIRRLESKIEDLTTAIKCSQAVPTIPHVIYTSSPTAQSHPSPALTVVQPAASPPHVKNLERAPLGALDSSGAVKLSFSQHAVPLWPAVKQILPAPFVAAREALPKEYIIDVENQRQPLPVHITIPPSSSPGSWLPRLQLSVIKGLADAYFAVFHRLTPILDKSYFFSSTLGSAMENDFGHDIDTCLVLMVLALGCLAVKAHEEGDFALPGHMPSPEPGFAQPEWYEMVLDDPPGLRFFNECRSRSGFLLCRNNLWTGQFYMLQTLYYAQILRPIDSWTTVNRAALCCTSVLARPEAIDFDTWEGDMFSRLFWNTLMYETIITQELTLPLSGLLDYEADVPIPKFTESPRPRTAISGLLVDEDDSFFNFHFLAQAAHRIILTRIRHNLYVFSESEGHPGPAITAEMHHQLEQWRTKLPPPLQFSDEDNADDSPSPAHVIAKAMLRSRYLVAKFHIGRPFLYKALHASQHTTDGEMLEIRRGLKGGTYWPTTMGLCAQMKSALPIKFGWCSQCFGQVLLFNVVACSPDPRLRETLPDGWQDWVGIMMGLLERCAQESPGIAKDVELLRLL